MRRQAHYRKIGALHPGDTGKSDHVLYSVPTSFVIGLVRVDVVFNPRPFEGTKRHFAGVDSGLNAGF